MRNLRSQSRYSREEKTVFWRAFGITLAVGILLVGLVAVDHQGRRLNQCDATPPLSIRPGPQGTTVLALRIFGLDKQFDFTKPMQLLETLWDFFCLPR